MTAVAKVGLAARAFVYLVIGWLAIKIALGHGRQQANQKGAIADIAGQPDGVVLLWVIGVGFAAYAVWRLSQAAFGVAGQAGKVGPRISSLISAFVYAALAVSTFAFIAGRSRGGQDQQQSSTTATVMHHGHGRWLVGLAGLVVVVVGLGMIFQGVTKKFTEELRMSELHGSAETFVVGLGVIGTVARGVVVAIAGALATDAAITFDPAKSTGLDGALRTLANQSYGPWLLTVVAAGLIAFGLYGFATVRWART